jgi:glycosyltransferase involved in cell wall biosynthesis
MKILFVTPEFEEKGRGIGFILKNMIAAAKADGHEVGILVGYPDMSFKKSNLLDEKIEHLYLQHYIRDGRESFKYTVPGGLRSRRNLVKILAGRSYLKSHYMDVKQQYFSDNPGLLKNVDFSVKIPYCYQFILHGLPTLPYRALHKAIRNNKIDLVITASPMDLDRKWVKPAKIAQFVHDVMPLELLETPPDNDTPRKYAHQIYTAAKQADLIMTNSEDTAGKVREINSGANIHVVYGSVSSKASELPESAVLHRNGLQSGKYLLFISVLEKRKNLENLFDAYSMVLPDIKMPLVLVGSTGFGFEDIYNSYQSLDDSVKKNIIFTGYISEADKYTLLKHANSLVWPSIYEGIGLPIIEALASDLPVLTSNRGALPEAGGKAALYVENPYDVHEIADKIKQIALDNKLRTELKSHAAEQVAKFTVEKFSARVSKALASIPNKKRK